MMLFRLIPPGPGREEGDLGVYDKSDPCGSDTTIYPAAAAEVFPALVYLVDVSGHYLSQGTFLSYNSSSFLFLPLSLLHLVSDLTNPTNSHNSEESLLVMKRTFEFFVSGRIADFLCAVRASQGWQDFQERDLVVHSNGDYVKPTSSTVGAITMMLLRKSLRTDRTEHLETSSHKDIVTSNDDFNTYTPEKKRNPTISRNDILEQRSSPHKSSLEENGEDVYHSQPDHLVGLYTSSRKFIPCEKGDKILSGTTFTSNTTNLSLPIKNA